VGAEGKKGEGKRVWSGPGLNIQRTFQGINHRQMRLKTITENPFPKTRSWGDGGQNLSLPPSGTLPRRA